MLEESFFTFFGAENEVKNASAAPMPPCAPLRAINAPVIAQTAAVAAATPKAVNDPFHKIYTEDFLLGIFLTNTGCEK